MTRGILIIGNESPVVHAMLTEARSRVQVVGAAIVPDRFAGLAPAAASQAKPAEGPKYTEGLMVWNPSSPVSARALVVGAENRLGRIDEAILVCTPPPIRRRADELVPAEIDFLVDDLIKGWFLVSRELAIVFRTRKAGTLAFVLAENIASSQKDETPDLFGVSVAASFRAFSQSMLAASFREPYRVQAFSNAEAGDDAGFASFVFKVLDEGAKKDSGKWHKYGRSGIFGLM